MSNVHRCILSGYSNVDNRLLLMSPCVLCLHWPTVYLFKVLSEVCWWVIAESWLRKKKTRHSFTLANVLNDNANMSTFIYNFYLNISTMLLLLLLLSSTIRLIPEYLNFSMSYSFVGRIVFMTVLKIIIEMLPKGQLENWMMPLLLSPLLSFPISFFLFCSLS